jgi:hypothetical protein
MPFCVWPLHAASEKPDFPKRYATSCRPALKHEDIMPAARLFLRIYASKDFAQPAMSLTRKGQLINIWFETP